VERRYTHHVVARMGGNKLRAAQVLGISRATLYRLLRGEGGPNQELLEAIDRPVETSRFRIQ
jgi:DNA-binding NtrC family response regulator